MIGYGGSVKNTFGCENGGEKNRDSGYVTKHNSTKPRCFNLVFDHAVAVIFHKNFHLHLTTRQSAVSFFLGGPERHESAVRVECRQE